MLDTNRIKELLGSGLSNDAVATAVGCDASYISQLMSAPEFSEAVIALRAAALEANTKRDKKIDGIEDQLIDKLDDMVAQGMIYKPGDILKSFAVVNAAKRRGVPQHESLILNQKIVNLNIPIQVVQQFVTNVKNEVIEAEGQTLVTMPAAELIKTLTANAGDGEKNAKYAKIANYLPGPITSGIGEADNRKS